MSSFTLESIKSSYLLLGLSVKVDMLGILRKVLKTFSKVSVMLSWQKDAMGSRYNSNLRLGMPKTIAGK